MMYVSDPGFLNTSGFSIVNMTFLVLLIVICVTPCTCFNPENKTNNFALAFKFSHALFAVLLHSVFPLKSLFSLNNLTNEWAEYAKTQIRIKYTFIYRKRINHFRSRSSEGTKFYHDEVLMRQKFLKTLV